MPIVLAALCIPCILNIDLCCLCINSKPEIKPYLKIHLAPGGCVCAHVAWVALAEYILAYCSPSSLTEGKNLEGPNTLF